MQMLTQVHDFVDGLGLWYEETLTVCQKFLRIEKEPVWRAVYLASRVRVPRRSCGRAWGVNPSGETTHTTSGTNALSLQSDDSESLQLRLANIRGQVGVRVYGCDLCNRPAYALPYRGCQKGVDVACIRSAEYDCHPRDLSALVDLVSHNCEEVGTGGKQRVKVGHHAVLPDESMRPIKVGVPVASHHLALAVDASGYAAKISRKKAEGGECLVLPKRAGLGCVVGAADCPDNLALVVIAEGGSTSFEVRKLGGSAVLP
jgi:hypothetical protein